MLQRGRFFLGEWIISKRRKLVNSPFNCQSAESQVIRRFYHCQQMCEHDYFHLGKEWGNLNGHPVLCMHGMADNCNSFKPMAPYLSPDHHYIAYDTFSHGRSSHFPALHSINFYDFLICLRRIVKHLNLSRFSVIGQSLGATVGLMYGSFYPEEIERLILLDIPKPAPIPLPFHTQDTGKSIDLALALEKKLHEGERKSYTMEELVTRYAKATGGTLSTESVRILMERGSKVVGDGFGYSHDPKMVNYLDKILQCIRFSIFDLNSGFTLGHTIQSRRPPIHNQKQLKVPSKNPQG